MGFSFRSWADEPDPLTYSEARLIRELAVVIEQRDTLLAALEAVEWVGAGNYCPWCSAWQHNGVHAPYCKRQAAIAAVSGEQEAE